MTLRLIEPPAELPVVSTDVYEHLRLPLNNGSPADREYVYSLIEKATAEVENYLGRALVTQAWEVSIDFRFPFVIELPLPPCQAVESIKYVDPDGETVTVDPAAYQVSGLNGDGKAEISALPGTAWPATKRVPEAVTVKFVAGYPGSGSPPDLIENIPSLIKHAIFETVATRYAFRERVGVGQGFSSLPASALDALDNYKLWGF